MTKIVGPADPQEVPRYGGFTTFARLPRLEDIGYANTIVLGVPFDGGCTFRPGARFGPGHIRESSRLLRPYNPELQIAAFGVCQVADAGDIACTPFDIPQAIEEIYAGAKRLFQPNTRLMTLGGDHTIALPMLRLMAERFGPLAVVHFDAHLDTWNAYFGSAYTHGTTFRRASEEGLIDKSRSVHVGLRGSIYGESDLRESEELGFRAISSMDIEMQGIPQAMNSILDRTRGGRVYVSIDIDVLDPSHAPGTGTPEAGGLTTRELLTMVRGFRELDVVSADVVEVSPPYDVSDLTGIAAANVAYELISLFSSNSQFSG